MFDDEIKREAGSWKLPVSVVRAIVQVESSYDPWATRFEPGWKWFVSLKTLVKVIRTTEMTEHIHEQTSWGLMQVMGAVARELEFKRPLPSICVPAVGLQLGCMKLSRLVKRYGMEGGIEAYNAGSPGKKAGIIYREKVLAAI